MAGACGGTTLTNPSFDAGSAVCVPGRSLACAGPGGCASSQVCNTSGTAYAACVCGEPADATVSTLPEASLPDANGGATTLCVPGQSLACTGPGGCASNQVCNANGTAFGSCTCASSSMDSGATTACIPGKSVACMGPGACISNQVCASDGSGYGACTCPTTDGSVAFCVPGQSIACTGTGGCFSSQVCNAAGTGYDECACADGGTVECEVPMDCENLLGPDVGVCEAMCPGGGMGCPHWICLRGFCLSTICG